MDRENTAEFTVAGFVELLTFQNILLILLTILTVSLGYVVDEISKTRQETKERETQKERVEFFKSVPLLRTSHSHGPGFYRIEIQNIGSGIAFISYLDMNYRILNSNKTFSGFFADLCPLLNNTLGETRAKRILRACIVNTLPKHAYILAPGEKLVLFETVYNPEVYDYMEEWIIMNELLHRTSILPVYHGIHGENNLWCEFRLSMPKLFTHQKFPKTRNFLPFSSKIIKQFLRSSEAGEDEKTDNPARPRHLVDSVSGLPESMDEEERKTLLAFDYFLGLPFGEYLKRMIGDTSSANRLKALNIHRVKHIWKLSVDDLVNIGFTLEQAQRLIYH